MKRSELLHLIKFCGDQTLPESERWKSITCVSVYNTGAISAFDRRIAADEVLFVDEVISDGGVEDRLTGFYVLENMTPEIDFFAKSKHITFVSCSVITVITFDNQDSITEKQKYANLTEFMTAPRL